MTSTLWAIVTKLFCPYFTNFLTKLECCRLQAFPAWSNKHSSLVRKSVNHGQKKFYNIGPWHCMIALSLFVYYDLYGTNSQYNILYPVHDPLKDLPASYSHKLRP